MTREREVRRTLSGAAGVRAVDLEAGDVIFGGGRERWTVASKERTRQGNARLALQSVDDPGAALLTTLSGSHVCEVEGLEVPA